MFISQPAISKHIHELEVLYNTQLFERTGGRIRLTAGGELLLSHAQNILSAYRQMEFEMNLLTNNFTGELKIGASTTIAQYVLPPVLSSFVKKFPNIKVSPMNGNSREIEQALQNGNITLGFVEGNARQSSLHYRPFLKDELVAITSINSKYAAYDEIDVSQLQSFPLVFRENGSGTLDVFEAALAEHNIKLSSLNVLMQLGSTESIKLFLESSDALGVVSVRAVSRELMAGRLKIIDVEGLKAERMFSIVLPQGAHGGLEESFIRFAENAVEAL